MKRGFKLLSSDDYLAMTAVSAGVLLLTFIFTGERPQRLAKRKRRQEEKTEAVA